MYPHNRADWCINNANQQETGDATGFFTPARAVDPRSGTRSSALTGYFEPNAHRKNLVVLTGAEATKVLFKPKGQDKKAPRVAEAVEFVSNGKTYKVYAKKEVIVSAGMSVLALVSNTCSPDARLFSGTFKTPQLLELSGIGDRNLLKNFGIETLIDLPGVGENLLDQTYTLIDYVAKDHVKTLGESRMLLVKPSISNCTASRTDEMRINASFAQEQIALQCAIIFLL
jgi:choline dehydrogenase-like flavoprotein